MTIIRGLILSFQLYTRIAIPGHIEFNKENLKIALIFLPLVGLILGFIPAMIIYIVRPKSHILAACLGLIAYLIASGSIHLDGLADMADGFFSNSSKEKITDIMADPSLGIFGSLAIIIYSILKIALFIEIPMDRLWFIPISSALARVFSLIIIQLGPLGPSAGFGAKMKEALGQDKKVLLYGIFLLIASLFISIKIIGPLLLMSLASLLIVRSSKNNIGGLTGDIYGASIEINDCLCLLAMFILI